MHEHESRQFDSLTTWQERYAKCSDLLSDAEERAEVAEAEAASLQEYLVEEARLWSLKCDRYRAERDHLREALERLAEIQPETHPGWNDEYVKASWVFEGVRTAVGVLLGTPARRRTPLIKDRGDASALTERIQSVLRAERDVRPDLYIPGSGQSWGHVDHRVARIVAEALLADHE